MASDSQTIMKFELLPNEIIFMCFQYINAVHIFHSFNQLNSRFNSLIRSIPLHLDFEDIHKLIFDEFCMNILLNPEIKAQVYSLHLSNNQIWSNVQSCLSFFSLDEFVHLRSLTLTLIKIEDIPYLIPMLPLISHLSCFRCILCWHARKEIFSVLPFSQLQTLHIGHMISDIDLTYNFSSIINLTIYKCDHFDRLYEILNTAPNLEYFKIQHVNGYMFSNKYRSGYFTNLQKLSIMNFNGEFYILVGLLKQTPNLKSLRIVSSYSHDMIDVSKWEDLINFSLPFLRSFKFYFENFYQDENEDMLHEHFKQFQSNFWRKYHWDIEYSLSKNFVSIYTIPYLSNKFELTSSSKRYYNQSRNKVNTFENVTDLIVDPCVLTEKCQYYFPNVSSLTFRYSLCSSDYAWLELKHIEYLKIMINLSHIKHLTIDWHSCKLETPVVLLEIFKESIHLISLGIGADLLLSSFDNDELLEYLNKFIKKLDIYFKFNDSLCKSFKLIQFCTVFSNLEQFKCTIHQRSSLICLIKRLPRLSYIKVHSLAVHLPITIPWLKEETAKLGIDIITSFDDVNYSMLSIWIIRDVY